jgi:peroxiredoxin
MKYRYLKAVLLVLMSFSLAHADEFKSVVSSEFRSLVPHRLMPLLHAPEVHAELKFSKEQVTKLENELFAAIDGPWFQARIEPQDKQMQLNDRIEQKAMQWMTTNGNADQLKRVKQLELQAQGSRMLLRSDVATALNLSSQQQKKISEIAKASDQAQAALQQATMKKEPTEALQEAATKAAKAEQDALTSLDAEQRKRLSALIGKPFETAKLQRIYPMAPEFVVDQQWLNSKPLTLKSLRGKVVLVHFYAFQCHNCQANFAIYRRWHERLAKKGVVVVGIQTPETPSERDPSAITAAATKNDLTFPIMIDLESKNWKAWGNTMWPTVYVVDKRGYLRHWWQGELNWQGATGDKTIENIVDLALAEDE